MDESKSSAVRDTEHPEARAGDPFVAAARSKRAMMIASDLASELCERCGGVADHDHEMDDGVVLCEGCVQ